MGVDDDFFARQALQQLARGLQTLAEGKPDDILVISDEDGHRQTTRGEYASSAASEAFLAAGNIRSAGDSQRPEQAKDRIRLDKATANIPGATATVKHIYAVREQMAGVIDDFKVRAVDHDSSKLKEPELSGFAAFTDMPKHGTPEYDARLKEMEPVLAEHYKNNDHHPEHWNKGIDAMPLPAMIEMLCDWRARAGESGKIDWAYSIKRFGIGSQLESILRATADYYGF